MQAGTPAVSRAGLGESSNRIALGLSHLQPATLGPPQQAASGSCRKLKREKPAAHQRGYQTKIKNRATLFSNQPSSARTIRFFHSFVFEGAGGLFFLSKE